MGWEGFRCTRANQENWHGHVRFTGYENFQRCVLHHAYVYVVDSSALIQVD